MYLNQEYCNYLILLLLNLDLYKSNFPCITFLHIYAHVCIMWSFILCSCMSFVITIFYQLGVVQNLHTYVHTVHTAHMQHCILTWFCIKQMDCLERVSSSKIRLNAQQHSSCWHVLNSSLRASLLLTASAPHTYICIACYIWTRLFKQLLTVLPALITSSYSGLKDLGIRFVLCHQITTLPTYQIHTRSHHVRLLMYNNLNYVWKQAKWRNKMLQWSLTNRWTTVTDMRRQCHMISSIN